MNSKKQTIYQLNQEETENLKPLKASKIESVIKNFVED